MKRWILIVLAVVLTAGGVAYMGSARYSGTPPGSINLERPKAVVQAELLTRYPLGSAAQPVRDTLLKAGMTLIGKTTTKSLEFYVKTPLTYDQPTSVEVYKKDRSGSPDPHTIDLVVGLGGDSVLDIFVLF